MPQNPINPAATSVPNCRRALVLVLFFCLLLRVGLAVYKHNAPFTGDAPVYSAIAKSLIRGDGFVIHLFNRHEATPSAYGCPVYPGFLAALYLMFPDTPFTVYLAQALLDVLTCMFVFQIALLATGKPRAAILASIAYSVYPPFIYMPATGYADTLGYFLLAASVLAFLKLRGRSVWGVGVAGALMGLLILTKPTMFLFPIFIALIVYITRRRKERWALKAACYIVGSYLVVAPWTIRNYLAMHAFIPVATHGGQTFWGGTGPADGKPLAIALAPVDTDKLNRYDDPYIPHVSNETYLRITKLQNRLRHMSEVEVDRTLMKEGVEEIKRHPGRFIILSISKALRTWFVVAFERRPTKGGILAGLGNLIIVIIAIIGLRKPGIDKSFKAVAIAFCIYITLVAMAAYGNPRYSIPAFLLLATPAAAVLNDRIRRPNIST